MQITLSWTMMMMKQGGEDDEVEEKDNDEEDWKGKKRRKRYSVVITVFHKTQTSETDTGPFVFLQSSAGQKVLTITQSRTYVLFLQSRPIVWK